MMQEKNKPVLASLVNFISNMVPKHLALSFA